MKKEKQTEPQPLTSDSLRTYPGLEHLNDKEAVLALHTINEIASIAFEFVMEQEMREIEEKRRNDLTDKNTTR